MPTLTKRQLNDISDIIARRIGHKDIDRAVDVHDAQALDALARSKHGHSIPSRVYGLLRESMDQGLCLELLGFFIQKLMVDPDGKRIYEILSGSPFTIELDQHNKMVVKARTTIPGQSQMATQSSFIAANANAKVNKHLEEARDKLAGGDTDGALSESRMALEAMTKNGTYHKALDELVTAGLIQKGVQGQQPPRRYDFESLYMAYGYCSTLGSHTSPTTVHPSISQAQYGIMQAELAIYRILEILAQAKAGKIALSEW